AEEGAAAGDGEAIKHAAAAPAHDRFAHGIIAQAVAGAQDARDVGGEIALIEGGFVAREAAEYADVWPHVEGLVAVGVDFGVVPRGAPYGHEAVCGVYAFLDGIESGGPALAVAAAGGIAVNIGLGVRGGA